MNLKRTVYSIAAGALILCHTPAHAFGLKQAIGYTLLMGSCTAAGVAYQWAREGYEKGMQLFDEAKNRGNEAANLRQNANDALKKANKLAVNQNANLACMGQAVEDAQANAIKLPKAINNAGNALESIAQGAQRVHASQEKAHSSLKKAKNAQKHNVKQFGLVNGILFGMRQKAQKQHDFSRGHFHNIQNDFNQAQSNLNDANNKIKPERNDLQQAIAIINGQQKNYDALNRQQQGCHQQVVKSPLWNQQQPWMQSNENTLIKSR